MWNFVTILYFWCIGPVISVYYKWPFLYDFVGSYLHNASQITNMDNDIDRLVTIDDVKATMSTFGLGELIGGLLISLQISHLGYKSSLIILMFMSSACFYVISVTKSLMILYIANFFFGVSHFNGTLTISFYMIKTYKDLGAAASGIGTCGVLLSGLFWALLSSI